MASISKTLTRLRPAEPRAFNLYSNRLFQPNDRPSPASFSTSAGAAAAAYILSDSSPSSQFHFREYKKKERPTRSKWFLFLPGAISFGLGTWQIFRRQEKIKTLEYRQKRLQMEPLKLNDITPSSESLEDLEFRRVVCKGVFDHAKSIYVGPRSRSISGVTENGYYVVTPLMPIANDAKSVQSPVLVNRGWVPRSWRDKSIEVPQHGEKSSSRVGDPVQQSEQTLAKLRFLSKQPKVVQDQGPAITSSEVIGVVRGSEKPSIFVPENDPNSRQWFYVDVPAIAVASGLPKDTLLIEDINENVNPSNPYPVPKDVNTLICSSVMPQDHLNYTLTWYSLSAAVTFMAFKRLKQKKSRR